MSHNERTNLAIGSNHRVSEILRDFFNNFDSDEVIENLLFITSDFVESPPNGISANLAFQWQFQMHCIAVLLPRLQIAILESLTAQNQPS